MNQLYPRIEYLGNAFTDKWKDIRALIGFTVDTFLAVMFAGKQVTGSLLRQVIGQILFTGVEALGLISVIGTIAGATIVMQARTNMPQIGVGAYFGNILVTIIVLELGPLITSLVVIGRSGSALAVYVGNMKLHRETDSLEVMGIDPVHFIVIPAFWGMVISLACLNVYFAVVGIGGGVIVARLIGVAENVPFMIFMKQVMEAFQWWHIVISLIKGTVFGILITIVSCFFGLQVKNIRGVPVAAIKSVVSAMSTMILLNIIFTLFVYIWIYA